MNVQIHCFLLAMALLATSLRAETRPNIIVIVADDLGYADLSFLPQSPRDVSTPALDQLAREGTYFSNAYATSPICSPSRCGLIMGRYQQRWGNYWYGQGGLPNEEVTLPQVLKKLGYSTKKIGKTHLNGGSAQHPHIHHFGNVVLPSGKS
ncbi:MAG: sulfatase-like hydrolase/transferase [Fuerstiella sp.]